MTRLLLIPLALLVTAGCSAGADTTTETKPTATTEAPTPHTTTTTLPALQWSVDNPELGCDYDDAQRHVADLTAERITDQQYLDWYACVQPQIDAEMERLLGS